MLNNNNKKKIIIRSIILITILIGGIAFAVTSFNDAHFKKTQQTSKYSTATKKSNAETKKKDGVKASISGDTEKAKKLLLEAKAEYQAINDTDNVIDTNAQLYFAEHPSTPPATTTPSSN